MALNSPPEQHWPPATGSYQHKIFMIHLNLKSHESGSDSLESEFDSLESEFDSLESEFDSLECNRELLALNRPPPPAKSRKMTALVGIVWGRSFSGNCLGKKF